MCVRNPGISLRASDDINPTRLHLQIHCIYAVKCTVTRARVKAHLYFCKYKSNYLENFEERNEGKQVIYLSIFSAPNKKTNKSYFFILRFQLIPGI